MKIEKIKNFNQIILAIASIIGIIFLIFALVVLISESGIFNRPYYHNSNSLISEEKTEKFNQENLRKQIVSYQSPLLIDTLNAVYIIPVSVTTLKKAERTEIYEVAAASENENLDLFSSHSKGYSHKQNFYGQYANLIVFQSVIDKTNLLFNERIMLNELQAYYFKDDILLVFYLNEKDTNKDGLVNSEDDNNLCIYSFKTEKMRKITDNANSIKNYQFIENSKNLLVEFALNQYKEVKFDSYSKPTKIMKYEFETEKLSEIVPDEIQAQMQKLVEGKK
ncbi:MAG: hypothetical protein LBS50_00895 [Prevotellaceae bacterium]|jgi:hypothetical protein|nr:hypothetical protein [Prevotellaceae bacterium]